MSTREHFDESTQQRRYNFRVGQKVVIFNDNDEILFLKRSQKISRPGGWDFPGGGLEIEQPLAGAVRETKEEAGIAISEVRPIHLHTELSHQSGTQLLLVGHLARTNQTQITLSWEHTDFQWLPIADAVKVELPDAHRKFLQAAIDVHQRT